MDFINNIFHERSLRRVVAACATIEGTTDNSQATTRGELKSGGFYPP
jgi:hypothetical protein